MQKRTPSTRNSGPSGAAATGSKSAGSSARPSGTSAQAGAPNEDSDAGPSAGGAGRGAAPQAKALRAAAERTGRMFGAAVASAHLGEAAYTATVKAEFNLLTPENELKWDATEPTRSMFRFDAADQLFEFAQQNGMQLKGHALVWHSQLPAWVGALREENELRTALLHHITQLMLHYKGKVAVWDVVNEAVADGGMGLRDSVFAQYLGKDCLSSLSTTRCYLDDAFRAAREADPDAKLYYNDYGAEGASAKADYVYSLVKAMLARGVPIDGVGLQLHTGAPDTAPTAAQLSGNMQRLAALGLDVSISELDVELCNNADAAAQRARYHSLITVCLGEPRCRAISVWGVTDKYSWKNGMTCVSPNPLLFDANFTKKPAYTGALAALNGE